MICSFKRFLLITIIHWTEGRNFLFDYSGDKLVSPEVFRTRRRPVSSVNSNTIDNIFQIPIAVIQGTSAAAQSWSPENGETINRVFDIPVQTLQAISHLIKDRMPQSINNNNQNKLIHQNHRYQDHTNHKRHIPYNGLNWATTWSNLFFGGHNNLNIIPHNMKKKKRKMKKIHHGSHGNHFGQHGHGHQHIISQRPQEILGGNGNIYHVTENVDDAVPLPPWRPLKTSDRIQNKIAPRFYDQF